MSRRFPHPVLGLAVAWSVYCLLGLVLGLVLTLWGAGAGTTEQALPVLVALGVGHAVARGAGDRHLPHLARGLVVAWAVFLLPVLLLGMLLGPFGMGAVELVLLAAVALGAGYWVGRGPTSVRQDVAHAGGPAR